MSTSIGGLELVFRSSLATEPWLRDPAVVPIPFRQQVMDSYLSRAARDGTASDKPLKLGILTTNRMVRPHPPISRGIRMVADAVQKAGHKVSGLVLGLHPLARTGIDGGRFLGLPNVHSPLLGCRLGSSEL